MNIALATDYIAAYKADFQRINKFEYYKWQAIKCFQDHWDIDAEDFSEMLERSLSISKNLLGSGNYFPKRMIIAYAVREPATIRNLFIMLFDEEVDLYERLKKFKIGAKEINAKYFSGRNPFQDIRAMIVYLSLRYPDRYFLYKYQMYKTLATKLQLPYSPKQGKVEELGSYLEICKIIRHEISKDQELVALHRKRLGTDCYADENLNVLTQDVIFAIDKHLGNIERSLLYGLGKFDEDDTENRSSSPRGKDTFKGKKTNHLENEKEKKRIGNLGELWVLKYEENRLRNLDLAYRIKDMRQISQLDGDGTGYDILSFDRNGHLYIEVKTTTLHCNTPFVVTRTELERSNLEKDRYRLYRLYNFDEHTNQADLLVLKGSLEGLCTEPERYSIKLNEVAE